MNASRVQLMHYWREIATSESVPKLGRELTRTPPGLRPSKRLDQQERADTDKSEIEVFEKDSAVKSVIDHPSPKNAKQCKGQRQHKIAGHFASPESSKPITCHADGAGWQKIPLQRGPELLRGPTAPGPRRPPAADRSSHKPRRARRNR